MRSDDDPRLEAVSTALLRTMLCLDCLAAEVQLPVADVQRALLGLRRTIAIDAWGPCSACGTRIHIFGIAAQSK